jgi:hypothetical protein
MVISCRHPCLSSPDPSTRSVTSTHGRPSPPIAPKAWAIHWNEGLMRGLDCGTQGTDGEGVYVDHLYIRVCVKHLSLTIRVCMTNAPDGPGRGTVVGPPRR